jgi:hypothetical protein
MVSLAELPCTLLNKPSRPFEPHEMAVMLIALHSAEAAARDPQDACVRRARADLMKVEPYVFLTGLMRGRGVEADEWLTTIAASLCANWTHCLMWAYTLKVMGDRAGRPPGLDDYPDAFPLGAPAIEAYEQAWKESAGGKRYEDDTLWERNY